MTSDAMRFVAMRCDLLRSDAMRHYITLHYIGTESIKTVHRMGNRYRCLLPRLEQFLGKYERDGRAEPVSSQKSEIVIE